MGRRNTSQRGPLPDVEVRADDPAISRFAGLVPLMRFGFGELKLADDLRGVVGATSSRQRRYPVHLVLLAFVWCALGGFHKLAHLDGLRGDPILQKFSRLSSWPVRKVFSARLPSCRTPRSPSWLH